MRLDRSRVRRPERDLQLDRRSSGTSRQAVLDLLFRSLSEFRQGELLRSRLGGELPPGLGHPPRPRPRPTSEPTSSTLERIRRFAARQKAH